MLISSSQQKLNSFFAGSFKGKKSENKHKSNCTQINQQEIQHDFYNPIYEIMRLSSSKITFKGNPPPLEDTVIDNLTNMSFERTELRLQKMGRFDTLEDYDTLFRIGNSYFEKSKYWDALTCYNRTFKLAEARFGPIHTETITALDNVADCYTCLKNDDKAIEVLKDIIERAKAREDWPNKFYTSLDDLGNAYLRQNDLNNAVISLEESANIASKKMGSNYPNLADKYNLLGKVYLRLNLYPAAIKSFKRAIEIFEKSLDPKHLQELAGAYSASGAFESKELASMVYNYYDFEGIVNFAKEQIAVKEERANDEPSLASLAKFYSELYSSISIIGENNP